MHNVWIYICGDLVHFPMYLTASVLRISSLVKGGAGETITICHKEMCIIIS